MMKIFWVGNVYPNAWEQIFVKERDEERELSYRELKEKIDASGTDYFTTGWCKALRSIGYETENVIWNAVELQNLWLKEYLGRYKSSSLEEILLQQIKEYRPEILFANDCCSASFLQQIKSEVSALRLVIGWAGSAVAKDRSRQGLWKAMDFILCCAPESVSYLQQEGAHAVHMNHAFPVEILPALHKNFDKHSEISFVGSIVRGEEYHLCRERLLLGLLGSLPLDIYSPSATITNRELIKMILAMGIYDMAHLFSAEVRTRILSKIPILGRVCTRIERPMLPVNDTLQKYMRPPVFGIDMFNILFNSDIVLNIHADSSPQFASNMRMFEATGVGTCLLTDNKKNMEELFVPGQEVVTYDSVEECIEKAKWLQAHPRERQEIAEAGKRRCLKEHAYENRAVMFDHIVKKALKYGK